MAIAGSCVSTMEKHRFWITTPPESATSLHTGNACKRQVGRLASLASPHLGQYDLFTRHGQHRNSTWAGQSRMSSQPRWPSGLAIGIRFGSNAGAISGAETVAPLVV